VKHGLKNPRAANNDLPSIIPSFLKKFRPKITLSKIQTLDMFLGSHYYLSHSTLQNK
jgi:hypothetical protein